METLNKTLSAALTPVRVARISVGLVLLTEGMQKYLFPQILGTGQSEKTGIDRSEFRAYISGTFEVIYGILVLTGFLPNLAAIPLIILMILTFLSTKIPVLETHGFWSFVQSFT
jgi:uncharacterized membrane protein YphA (DoxX/SURF4 family)